MKKVLMVLLALMMVMSFVACSDDDVDPTVVSIPAWVPTPAAGEYVIAFTGTYTAADNVVYAGGTMGAFTNVTTGTACLDWFGSITNMTNGASESLAFTPSTTEGHYMIIKPFATITNATLVELKLVNNDSTLMTDTVLLAGGSTSAWDVTAEQADADGTQIGIDATGKIVSCVNAGSTPTFGINAAGNVIVVDFASFSTWATNTLTVCTTEEVTLTINWSGVPASHVADGEDGAVDWADLGDGDAIVVGGQTWLHTDGTSEWTPSLGTPVSVPGDGTATVTLTVPSGISAAASLKLGNINGWHYGEEENNHDVTFGVTSPQTLDLVFDTRD